MPRMIRSTSIPMPIFVRASCDCGSPLKNLTSAGIRDPAAMTPERMNMMSMNCLPKLIVFDLISDRMDDGLNSPAARHEVQIELTVSASETSTRVINVFLVLIIDSLVNRFTVLILHYWNKNNAKIHY